MRTATDWRNRLWAGAMVALAAAGALVWWWRDRPMPLDHLADVAAIAEKFEEVVFQNDHQPDNKLISRWSGRIDIVFATKLPPSIESRFDPQISEIAALTGLQIRKSAMNSNSGLELHLAPRRQFRKLAIAYTQDKNYQTEWLAKVACYAITDARRSIIEKGTIVVSDSLTDRETRSCLLEELYQSLGPGKDSRKLRYSITSNGDDITELSLNDKLILRALYDDRIKPGMPRAEAMVVVRQVIAELHAAVRAHGPDALIHPRHKARQAQ